jgi:hypothetical protein
MSTLTTHTTASRATPSGSNIGLCKFNTTTNDIEVSDGTNWQVYNPDAATGWSGSNTYSLNFDGTDDHLALSSSVTSTAQQGTVSFWIKTSYSGPGQNQTIFSQADSSITSSYLFFGVLTTGEVRIGWADGGSVLIKKGSTTINNGNWHHVACTSNGSAWKIYIDGSDEGTLTTVTGSAPDGSWYGDITSGSLDICRIGCQERTSKDSFVNGSLDELAVWDSALSAAQITNIYKGESDGGSGGTNGTPGSLMSFSPKAWWRMGDGIEANSGTTVYDMSSFSNDMTMVSSPAYQADTP